MSYVFSDKAMVWLLSNCVFIGAYAYSQQKGMIEEVVKMIWEKGLAVVVDLASKIPKHKTE